MLCLVSLYSKPGLPSPTIIFTPHLLSTPHTISRRCGVHLIPDILQTLKLIVRKYRAVFAGVIRPDPAMPALAYAARHILLHREIYTAIFESEVEEFECYELHHYWRAANYGYGIVDIDGFGFQ